MQTSQCDILLIHPPYHRRAGSGLVPPVGLAYLCSSLANAGYTYEVIDCALYFSSLDDVSLDKLGDWLQAILSEHSPRLAIGIGPCTTSAIRSILIISEICRRSHPDVPLLFGGPLTLIPQQEWLFFDRLKAFAVVRGDGEYVLPQLLASLHSGSISTPIRGVQTLDHRQALPRFEEDIDGLLFPDWRRFSLEAYRPSLRRDLFTYPFVPVIGSRGCPNACSFCVSGQLVKFRRRSFNSIASEVGKLQQLYGVRAVIFFDDCLFYDAGKVNHELLDFATQIDEAAPGVMWQIEMRPDVFSNLSPCIANYIFERGCRQINLGIESVSQVRQSLFHKRFPVNEFRSACDRIVGSCPRLRLAGTFIVGGPHETQQTIEECVDFSTQLGLLFAHFNPLALYPGTPLYESVNGTNAHDWFDRVLQHEHLHGEVLYETESFPATRLLHSIGLAYARFYDREEWRVLAKRHLGEQYWRISEHIASWAKDRFRLGEQNVHNVIHL